nr:zinc finger and BTB domain-containing protein 24-like [Penaeus vannamei]
MTKSKTSPKHGQVMFGVGSNEGVPAMWGNMVPTAQEENYSHRMNQAKDQRLDLPQGHTQRSDPRIFCCIHFSAGWPRGWVGSDPSLEESGSLDHLVTTKQFKCADCDKAFATRWEYERHRRTHTGEKPFACQICPYRATQKTSLQKHLRTHSGEKPYACHFCTYRASQKVHLQNHIRTHSSDTFSCPHCPFRTNRYDVLKKHIPTHPSEK